MRDGRTCLHRACEATNPQNVALLLKRDEELANIVDYAGDTGLHLACNQAHKQTVQTLLVSGRNVGCGMHDVVALFRISSLS